MTDGPEIDQEQPVSLLGLLADQPPAAAQRKWGSARRAADNSASEPSHRNHLPHKTFSASRQVAAVAEAADPAPTELLAKDVEAAGADSGSSGRSSTGTAVPAAVPASAALPAPAPPAGEPYLLAPPVPVPTPAVEVPPPSAPLPVPAASRRPPLVNRVKGTVWRRRAAEPLPHPKRVAVVSLTGGSGRTTVALALGDVLSTERREPVAVLDASPLLGSLASRAGGGGVVTTMGLLAQHQQYGRVGTPAPPAFRRPSGLSVIGSDNRAEARYVLGADGYRWLAELMPRHYELTITDAPAGLADPGGLVNAILPASDLLILTTTATTTSASMTLNALSWLVENGFRMLARRVVLVINAARPGDPGVGAETIAAYYRTRVHAVVTVPWDAHLAEGGPLDSAHLSAAARSAYLELGAATVTALLSTK